MKSLFTFFFLLATELSFSQGQTLIFSYVDRKVQKVEVSSPDSLAQNLTSPYATDLEKSVQFLDGSLKIFPTEQKMW